MHIAAGRGLRPSRPCARGALRGLTFLALLAISAAVSCVPAGAGEPPSPTAGRGCGSPEECFARMKAAQRDVAKIDARFRQTKHVAMLADPLISEGRFSFERPGKVRWEMVTPEPLVVEISGEQLRAGPPGDVATVEAGTAVALFRDLAGIFTGAEDYAGTRFTLAPGHGANAFVLTPRDPSVARVITKIGIELDPESGGPRRVTMSEASGDSTEIELRDVVVERASAPS